MEVVLAKKPFSSLKVFNQIMTKKERGIPRVLANC